MHTNFHHAVCSYAFPPGLAVLWSIYDIDGLGVANGQEIGGDADDLAVLLVQGTLNQVSSAIANDSPVPQWCDRCPEGSGKVA